MAVRLQEMTGEELLLMRALGEPEYWESIDRELDRRAAVCPLARRVVIRRRRRPVRSKPAPGQLVA